MRTAALALLIGLLTFTAAPSAFAETPETQLQGSYFTKDGKHYVEVALPNADHPQGNWIVTLNGSNEQVSPEGSQSEQFTSNYDDLIEGRNYQVIAVWYGKNGGTNADLSACFQFTAKDPASNKGEKVQLRDCGFKPAPAPKDSGQNLPAADDSNASAGQNPQTDAASDKPTEDGKTPDASVEQKADSPSKEETGSLFNLNSASKEGGKLPDTTLSGSWATAGLQLVVTGFALLGFRRAHSEDR
ncbi:hypothetical protein [Salinithrix halophila]|uniref:LPXTG-motif cell wall anchor domain-containing protein n=1 Tax=Salinithrix halophila TaxID=1485204 RepID=A0ABV8JGH3_9BACL